QRKGNISPHVHYFEVMERAQDLQLCKDLFMFFGGHIDLCDIQLTDIIQCTIYMSKACPHEFPCSNHTIFVGCPSVIMHPDVIAIIITMLSFLRPSYLIRAQFGMIIMPTSACRR